MPAALYFFDAIADLSKGELLPEVRFIGKRARQTRKDLCANPSTPVEQRKLGQRLLRTRYDRDDQPKPAEQGRHAKSVRKRRWGASLRHDR